MTLVWARIKKIKAIPRPGKPGYWDYVDDGYYPWEVAKLDYDPILKENIISFIGEEDHRYVEEGNIEIGKPVEVPEEYRATPN